jgi:hypothetical protein
MTANRAASIRDRLKQHADAAKEDFDLVLTRYGIERLLYRLATSEHAPQFVLKGALLFALWYGQPHRPTRDADLLGFGPDDPQALATVFQSLCLMQVDDGVQFDAASVRVGTIRKEARYGGLRVDIQATLDNARIALQDPLCTARRYLPNTVFSNSVVRAAGLARIFFSSSPTMWNSPSSDLSVT